MDRERSSKTSESESVIKKFLGDYVNDPELQEMCLKLTEWGKLLNAKPNDAIEGFARKIADAYAEYLDAPQKRKLIDELNDLQKFFESEKTRVQLLFEEAMAELNAAGGIRAYKDEKDKLMSQLNEKYNKMKEDIARMEKDLSSYGYSDEISDESMAKMEKQLKSLEEENELILKELKPFEGLEPTESSVRRRIQEVKEEIVKVEDALRRGSSFCQSFS